MDIKQLEIFCAVAELGNISKAADRLFLSKQAVSKSIKLLEEELDSSFFTRTGRNITLTQGGRIFFVKARKICTDFRNLETEYKKSDVTGPITVAAVSGTIFYYLTSIDESLFDNGSVISFDRSPEEMLKKLKSNEITAIIDYERPIYKGLERRFLFDEQVFVYLTPDHKWFDRTEIPVGELSGSSVCILEGERYWTEDFCRVSGISPTIEAYEYRIFERVFFNKNAINLYPDFNTKGPTDDFGRYKDIPHKQIPVTGCPERKLYIWYFRKSTYRLRRLLACCGE